MLCVTQKITFNEDSEEFFDFSLNRGKLAEQGTHSCRPSGLRPQRLSPILHTSSPWYTMTQCRKHLDCDLLGKACLLGMLHLLSNWSDLLVFHYASGHRR